VQIFRRTASVRHHSLSGLYFIGLDPATVLAKEYRYIRPLPLASNFAYFRNSSVDFFLAESFDVIRSL
jgi:hypothetical protein